MIMIQNMKNIKSKFRIDLKYLTQHISLKFSEMEYMLIFIKLYCESSF